MHVSRSTQSNVSQTNKVRVEIATVNDTAGTIQELLTPCLLWMRAAATRRSPAQPAALAQPYFAIARHHPQLVAFRWSKVNVGVPAFGNAPVLMGATHIAQSVGNLANQILVGQRAEDDRPEEEKVEKRKTAGKKWEATLQPLLNLTHQTTTETLASVWHKLAESHTKRENNVIQTAMDALARKARSRFLPPPFMPSRHSKTLGWCWLSSCALAIPWRQNSKTS
jgi:hypothetical protein